MSRSYAAILTGMSIFGIAGPANAIIYLSPSTAGVISGDHGGPNCEPDCVETTFGVEDGSLSLLYKAEVGGADSGLFAGSYDTTFLNSANDPSGALIDYIGGAAISCPSCYLAIKDGNHNPSYYFYDLSAWDGTELIALSNFWPGRGAISHLSIWGADTSTNVPEPATLGLLSLGLLGVGAVRRKRTN
ncbi:MAG TPA: PEP-CTERM sorting domain-containing protein [Steroidobacter sp.]|nr:PEP-CTERM sorting domain-containing protein [Steroidobacter sp.]